MKCSRHILNRKRISLRGRIAADVDIFGRGFQKAEILEVEWGSDIEGSNKSKILIRNIQDA